MYSTCLHCHHALGTNEAVEQFPIGRRLAFDSAKGRLWVVCRRCARWNLTPIEERWEAVEQCERQFRGLKTRAQTGNIGLAKTADGTELVRIGAPLRPEFAAWRYGGVFRSRLRKRVGLVAGVSGVVGAAGLVVAGAPMLATLSPILLMPVFHASLVGFVLRGGVSNAKVIGEHGKTLRVTKSNLDHTRLIVNDGMLRLQLRHSYGRQELEGDRAVRALSTLMIFANRGGGAESTVDAAARMISDVGDPRKAIANISREAERRTGDFEERYAETIRAPRGRTIGEIMRIQMEAQANRRGWSNMPPTNNGALHRLPATHRLALEMALHESYEELALNDELALLERAWREAEEIAAIADDLLVPEDIRARIGASPR